MTVQSFSQTNLLMHHFFYNMPGAAKTCFRLLELFLTAIYRGPITKQQVVQIFLKFDKYIVVPEYSILHQKWPY